MNRILISAVMALATLTASSADCEIAIGIAPVIEGDNVPAAVARQLEARLKTALTKVGVSAGDYDCQFFITGRFDHAYSQQAAGPGGRVLVNTNLQLAICDGENRKVFATETFPLKGVGASDQQALTRGLSSLGLNNKAFVDFVENGKAKIVDYFNKNYPTYISKSERALMARNYDESLYWASMIPECCQGYEQASVLINNVLSDKVNYEAQMLLAQAEGAWAADPTSAGAQQAYSYLAQIDPSAKCYAQAQALGKKISATVKDNYDFENKTKYMMAHEREKQRIEAARAVGIAWAQNQPKTIVRNNWIVW